ncbi:MAG: SUMF1/EgtB/PvdO family nonheme iron enzyme [Muribaculaceae bacterium]|nr:SUMF1/EgtB/PvdO family nonheme iron enzyme [Muribaculaceae bacterium]
MKTINLKTIALVACMLLGLCATAQVQGDLTGDGNVDIADVNAVINMMLGKTPQTAAGDVTGDNNVDIADVNAVINIMLGKTNQEVQNVTVNGVSFKMVAVEGGTFTMGATAEQGNDVGSEEKPTHQVTLSAYSIGQTEVTQELWQAVMGDNPSYYTDNLQRPVEQVSWDDCQAFITKLNQMTGKNFRLPTEAEWEYAARGGNKSQGYKYAGSNNVDDVAWYDGNSGMETHHVATKAPNELGLYDMSGNVWEWCQDWFGNYSSDAQTNPTGPTSGSYCVTRGGSWGYNGWSSRVSRRNNNSPSLISYYYGLRLAL